MAIENYKNWAIIPARSGSKGIKDKNIKYLAGIPLMAHAINFALKSKSFDKVLVSTDSLEYSNIAKSYGAYVPFLRSKESAQDNSMEEDILKDLDFKLRIHNIQPPDIITWFRPTFPFRSNTDLKNGLLLLNENVDSVRFVTETDSRIFSIKNNILNPVFHTQERSMIRRQEMPPAYNVYHTDIFWYKNITFGKKFLGQKSIPLIIDKICSIDIDTITDFFIAEALFNANSVQLNEYINLNQSL